MKTVRVADAELKVLVRGSGPPLVLMHAFPLDHSMWSAQIERFASHWQVIAPDLRGCGASDVTAGTVSMLQMADDLAAILDELKVDVPVVYCGLSMGGYIAWQFARKYPERLRALVLCDTRAKADTPEARESRMKMLDHVLRAGTGYVAEAMLPKLFAADTLARLPGAVEFVRERILLAPPTGVAAALRGIADRPDMTDFLPQIRVPTLVIVGEQDTITTADEMREMAAAIPGAELVVIKNVGHLTALESPVEFNAALARFLATRVESSRQAAVG
jgi:3-oxoadipate enol-lactonase